MLRRIALLLLLVMAGCGPNMNEADLPTLVPSSTPPPQAIDFWLPEAGALSLEDRFRDYRFSASQNDTIEVTAIGQELGLSLIDASGETLSTGVPLRAVIPANGEYTLRVQLLSGTAGTYEITLARVGERNPYLPTETPRPVTPTPTPPPFLALGTQQTVLTSTSPAFGAFNATDERHVYTFQGAQGSHVRLTMRRTSGTLDPLLTLYNPDGVAIAVDDNGGGGRTALINGARLPRDGVYGVVAAGNGQTGTYELTLESAPGAFPVTPVVDGVGLANAATEAPPLVLTPTLAPVVNGTLLLDHMPVQGVIDRAGGVQRMAIQGSSGDIVTIGLRPRGNFTPRLEVFGPSGGLVAEAVAGSPGEELLIPNFLISRGEPYIAFVTGVNDSTGEYVLSYGRGNTRENVRKGEIFPDRPYQSMMARVALRDVWFIVLNTGDMITASAVSDDGRFDPVMELIGPDGTVILSDDNSGGGLDATLSSFRAAVGGRYALRVRSATGTQVGSYSLIWRYIEAAPSPTPPLLVSDWFTVDDTVAADAPVTYPLQGSAGERVLIEVLAAPGSGLDAVLTLFNPAGEVLASDDDGGGNLNPRLLATIPADGLYQVEVAVYNTGNDPSGPFTLRVKRVY